MLSFFITLLGREDTFKHNLVIQFLHFSKVVAGEKPLIPTKSLKQAALEYSLTYLPMDSLKAGSCVLKAGRVLPSAPKVN